MKKFLQFLAASLVLTGVAAANGFTDSVVTFYGQVRQIGGGQTVLLQSGELEMTFVNQANPTNRVSLKTELRPTGQGADKLYSYAIDVPLAYLPAAPRITEFLAIGSTATNFRIQEIKIDGRSATLPDGSQEFYGLSFASRAADYRLDLLVSGENTDSDGDGLPDWWEKLYGLDHALADSGGDSDNDGWTNLQEYQQGANPTVSNRNPQLASAEILVPEAGKAGVFLHVLDSDTQPAGIQLEFTGSSNSSFTLNVDGAPLADGQASLLTLADLRAGRLTVHHANRAAALVSLPVRLGDGGEMTTASVFVRAAAPSTQDGNDAALWLDGLDLTGTRISTWPDRSGNSRNASQPLAAYQPAVKDGSADFSISASAHLFFQDLAISTANHTVLAAYQAASTSDAPQTLLSTNRGFMKISPTSQAISYPGSPTYQMDGLSAQGYVNVAGHQATSIFRREGTLLQNVFGLSYDGQNVAASAIDPVLPTLGGRRSAIPNASGPLDESFVGQLHELLVFPTALAEQKLRDVNDYLDSKWGGAVIWDLSTEIKSVNLTAASSSRPQTIRGGHGDDRIGGGALADTLSGGPGSDLLTGGAGDDRFVFGGLDTGADRIADFDLENDILDLSALFWNRTGDARQSIAGRLDADFSTATPTLNSVLIVTRPDATTQEITLENKVVGSSQLIQLIAEGRIRMGGLSIPSTVQIALAPGSPAGPTGESISEPFSIVITRSGAGIAAALDVPVGFFEEALGGKFVIDSAVENESHRAVIHFPRGVTSKTVTVRPVPDLKTAGSKTVQLAVLPQYKFSVGGAALTRTITDRPMVWLEVVQPSAISSLAQPAVVRVHRDGTSTDSLTIPLSLGGTAIEGTHIQDVPDALVISAGQSFAEISIQPLPAGLAKGPKVVHFKLLPGDLYQTGNPNEAVLYAAVSATEANGAGFDRWLQASTGGAMRSLADLSNLPRAAVSRYLQAYAFRLNSVDELASHQISFRVANGKPEILTKSPMNAADVRWKVESSPGLDQWADSSGTFTESADPTGVKLVGQTLPAHATSRFYRLGMNLEPGVLASSTIGKLVGNAPVGIGGKAVWKTNQSTGELTSSGESGRIISEIENGADLDFELQVTGGSAGDLLAFYIDGVKISETSGPTVRVQRELTGSHIIMWEFKRVTGHAVIRNLAP